MPYAAGSEVEVFYRLTRDGEGFFPVPNQAARCFKPRFGMTDGWVVARVLDDWPPPGTPSEDAAPVRVMHTHQLWADKYGQTLDPQRERDMVLSYPARDVRPLPKPGDATFVPTLSLLVVRWGGEETDFNVAQWGSASASTSSAYVSAFLDATVYPVLGPDYEVISVFVTSGFDLARLGPAALCPLLRGKHRAACYFLWPVMHQDGEVHESGMLDQSLYFDAVRVFEAAGVCTRFPHPSQLYRVLLAKDWQPTLCLVPSLRIPPCVTVNRATITASPARAAKLVVDALAAVRSSRYQSHKKKPKALRAEPMALVHEGDEERRGVAKLGFAWEAAHVRTFRGESELGHALLDLCTSPAVTTSSVIVQDFARNDFELRQFVINGQIVHRAYSNFEWVDGDGYFREFVVKDRADAVTAWMAADDAAMVDAERKATKLVAAWLAWFRTQSVEALPGVRIDVLVKRVGPAEAEVFTLELTELGFSMLGVNTLPPIVFGALLASCFEDTGATDEEARRLKEGSERLGKPTGVTKRGAAEERVEGTNGDAMPEGVAEPGHKRRRENGHAH